MSLSEQELKHRRRWLRERRRNHKRALIKLMGGACERCGNQEPLVLDFDHIDPEIKEFCIGEHLEMSWERLIKEAAKCRLLCANCHRIVTYEED